MFPLKQWEKHTRTAPDIRYSVYHLKNSTAERILLLFHEYKNSSIINQVINVQFVHLLYSSP